MKLEAKGSMVRRLGILVGLLVLGACATPPRPPPSSHVMIAPELTITLPTPGDLGRLVEVQQMVNAKYGDQDVAFEGNISVTPGRMVLVSLDGFGRRAMTVTWTDAGAITADVAPWVPKDLPPENVLADIMLTYWPAEAVRKALAGTGAEVVDTPGKRTIRRAGKDVVTVNYSGVTAQNWSGSATLENLAFGYQIAIQTIEAGR